MNGFMYRNGRWEEAMDGRRKQVTNPATMEAVGSVPIASREDVALAVDAASEAFPAWSARPAAERSSLLYRAYEELIKSRDEVAEILTLEQGKPLSESKGEVQFAAEFLRWYSEEAKRNYGEMIPASVPNKRIMVIHQPIGVVGAITPWNFPVSMVTRKLAPALAAGCTVVLKPADSTPLSAVLLFQIFDRAGFPPGVANLVTGRGSVVGAEFMENPKVKKITFTGSTEVGKTLIRDSAQQVKKLSLELGGHAPFIICDDADLETAVDACLISKFRNAGQTCICANRIYVHHSIMSSFSEKLAERTGQLKLGAGLDPDVQIGPLIDEQALEKVDLQVQDAVTKGARIVIGGKRWKGEGLAGAFYEPTVLSHVDKTMKICSEETFGPVAPLIVFSTEEEVLQQANGIDYGLAAYVFTQDLGRSFRIAEGLEYGVIGVNDAAPSVAQAPFGGWKESGTGREGGQYGLAAFMEVKYISLGIG
ncbi:NAD-dependent succinate-semialdehyde dehydrogenase [Paenibacillus nasutitermitis]|uniref:NAD-dependent succinate-semialdehyde dehydrogenase n=1 Tax=Paenibacillus nasutitermitis TaxID=1652958 RepID=A0A916YTY2_9BACL|nr:NAD-dependent succinate-semialdehyde dehydrogenase [Paenibacillus nasutitermitis]GGD61655.1 NAD-dependent succinate-semialdehyde dehydrogenase [Paenibacillus nasutitermitis]